MPANPQPQLKVVKLINFLKCFLLVCPIRLPIFFLFSMNEPELGAEIDPGMAFNPFPSSILAKTK